MDEQLTLRICGYLNRRQGRLIQELGSGVDGVVYLMSDNRNHGRSAVKFHRAADGFRRERDVYLRLKEHDVFAVQGSAIPELLAWDDEFMAIEMTVVDRPFVLDFAGAWLDEVPDFTPDPYGDDERRERFGDHWPVVERIVAELGSHGVYLFDLWPGNIAFRD